MSQSSTGAASDITANHDTNWIWVLFEFEGRLNRYRYWIGFLISMIPIGILTLTSVIVASVGNESVSNLIFIVNLIVSSWMIFSLTIKRWHDLNQSGWFSIFGFIPFVNIILGFIKGTEGNNKYSSNPVYTEKKEEVSSSHLNQMKATLSNSFTTYAQKSKCECHNCSTLINCSDKFCPNCGAMVRIQPTPQVNLGAKKECENCRVENESDASFCVKCGTGFSPSIEKSTAPAIEENKIASFTVVDDTQQISNPVKIDSIDKTFQEAHEKITKQKETSEKSRIAIAQELEEYQNKKRDEVAEKHSDFLKVLFYLFIFTVVIFLLIFKLSS
jgi:uncharacterized membrane protein YhaH (DUF805 family)